MKQLGILIALLTLSLALVGRSAAQETEASAVDAPVELTDVEATDEAPTGMAQEDQSAVDASDSDEGVQTESSSDEDASGAGEPELGDDASGSEMTDDDASIEETEPMTEETTESSADESATTEDAAESGESASTDEESAESAETGAAEGSESTEAESAETEEKAADGECIAVITKVDQEDASHAIKVVCSQCGTCCDGCQRDAGTDNWATIGAVLVDTSGSRDSYDQYGTNPDGFLTSGRFHTKAGYDAWDRVEARWQDVHADGGRSWVRIALWPVTLEMSSALISGRAWDSFGADPALVKQEATMDKARLRLHRGEFKRMELAYERFNLNRNDPTLLDDLTVNRMSYRYNFKLGGLDTVGQVRQIGTSIDTDVPGATGRINQTKVKLDSQLDDHLAAYTRIDYSAYDYDGLPDHEFAGADWTVGVRYIPADCWGVTAEMRTKENPDDNTVSSHVRNLFEMGLAVNYAACGNSYEVGYQARRLDYFRLNMQDPVVFSLLRQPSAITPGQVGNAVDILTPTQDRYWLDVRQKLGDDLTFTTRMDFSGGDQPGTDLVATASPSLFYDEQLSRRHGLSYAPDCENQFEISVSGQESLNTERDSHFNQNYIEGSWLHRLDACSSFTLAWRTTDVSLTAPTFDGSLYTTDDRTYVATYGHNQNDFDYTLNLSLSDGSGAQQYTQTGAGASIRFKDVPLGLRVDWLDRDYTTFPGLNGDGLSLAIDYRFTF